MKHIIIGPAFLVILLAQMTPARLSGSVPTPDAQGDTPAAVGIFEGHGDVGTVEQQGSVFYEAAAGSYTVTGSGEDMWSTSDAFHFAWKRVSGDVSMAADVVLRGSGTEPHRKAVLMIRQSLDGDAAYVDAALHGNASRRCNFAITRATPHTKCRRTSLVPPRCGSRSAAST
jgi:hypothetical protein